MAVYLGSSEVNLFSGQPSGTPTLQSVAKSYTPTEAQQSESITASAGYDGLSEVDVTVYAVPSTYVGSGIPTQSSANLTASGSTVTAPSGYYSSAATKNVSSGSASPPASITSTAATVSTGTNTLTLSKTVSVTPTVTAGYVSTGTAGNVNVSLTGNVTTQGASTYYPSTADQTITSRYLTGTQTFKSVTTSNITADNIKSGVVVQVGDSADSDRVLSVTGTYSGGGGSGKNVQMSIARYETNASAYTATNLKITVSKAGTYSCHWSMDRNTTSGTNGSRLYKGTTAQGTAHSTWTHNGATCTETLTLAANDVLTVYARARNTSYYVGVSNLIIEEQ